MPLDDESWKDGGGGDGDDRHANMNAVSNATLEAMAVMCKATDTCSMCTAQMTTLRIQISVVHSNMKNRGWSLERAIQEFDEDISTMREIICEKLIAMEAREHD